MFKMGKDMALVFLWIQFFGFQMYGEFGPRLPWSQDTDVEFLISYAYLAHNRQKGSWNSSMGVNPPTRGTRPDWSMRATSESSKPPSNVPSSKDRLLGGRAPASEELSPQVWGCEGFDTYMGWVF